MFIVDDSYDLEAVNILAAHAQGIDPRVRDILEEHWTGSRSLDFLQGLVAGYANSHAAFTQQPELAQEETLRPVSTLAAFAAEKLLERLDSLEDPDNVPDNPSFPRPPLTGLASDI